MANKTNTLADCFSVKRRYSRSVNLERDLEQPEALDGYILTQRSVDALRRILSGIGQGTSNAWTLTSVYGTGKSALAHYLASLCASSKSPMRLLSLEITQTALGKESEEYQALESSIPQQGYLRAVAVAQREPISHTVIRALIRGVETFWTPVKRKKIEAVSKLQELVTEIELGNTIDGKEIPALVRELAKASNTGLFLIVDELGKNLEYAASDRGAEDLYLLQQLAELPRDDKHPIYAWCELNFSKLRRIEKSKHQSQNDDARKAAKYERSF